MYQTFPSTDETSVASHSSTVGIMFNKTE